MPVAAWCYSVTGSWPQHAPSWGLRTLAQLLLKSQLFVNRSELLPEGFSKRVPGFEGPVEVVTQFRAPIHGG